LGGKQHIHQQPIAHGQTEIVPQEYKLLGLIKGSGVGSDQSAAGVREGDVGFGDPVIENARQGVFTKPGDAEIVNELSLRNRGCEAGGNG
jgi:hypothetical protein